MHFSDAMRWSRRWLRSVLVSALTIAFFAFAFLTIITNSFKDNYFADKTIYESKPKYLGIEVRDKHFEPSFHLRRNSTDLPISEWHSSVGDNQLLDINDFEFLRNCSHLCSSAAQPFLVALVHSSPKNFLKRDVIRKTWGALRTVNGYSVIVVFILGLVNDSTVDRLLHNEYRIHKDLVSAKFVDSYHNLTYKHLTSYKWVLKFCNTTKLVMKADDDAFIDIFRTVNVLKQTFYPSGDGLSASSSQLPNYTPANIIACSLFPEGTPPKRQGKWALTLSQYPYHTYPAYCSGVAYFFTLDIAFDIFEAAHRIKQSKAVETLPIDDVFLTGIVSAYLNLKHFPLNMKYVYDHKRVREWLREPNPSHNSYMVADIGDVDDWPSLMTSLWTKTLRIWS